MRCLLPAKIQGCLIAGSGLSRLSGSQRRHLAMKSTKSSSLHLRACARVLVPGLRRFPFELTMGLGVPVESKKSLRRELLSTKYLSGSPKTSMMQASCSCSFSPGNRGAPVYNSAMMHPRLQVSMAEEANGKRGKGNCQTQTREATMGRKRLTSTVRQTKNDLW